VVEQLVIHNLKPISINSVYGSIGQGFYKTSHATEWTYQVFDALSREENQEKLKRLRDYFDPNLHNYAIRLIAIYPHSEYTTKKGLVSSRTIDITNWEKPLIDCIFLPKFFELSPPSGCQNLNMDDKFLTEMFSKKKAGDEYRIEIEISILSREACV
jgi:hypothetical protein